MIQNQLPDSACQAQAILGAWRSGDIQQFCEELDRVEVAAAAGEAEESERMELLRAIAADLRVPSLQPPVDDPGNIYGNLLRHLAFSTKPVSVRAVRTPWVSETATSPKKKAVLVLQ